MMAELIDRVQKKYEATELLRGAQVSPVLMTALTTILAMSTMALGMGDGAEMTQPMAIVSIGGLAYATLLTLFVVPVLYDLLRKKPLRAIDAREDAPAQQSAAAGEGV